MLTDEAFSFDDRNVTPLSNLELREMWAALCSYGRQQDDRVVSEALSLEARHARRNLEFIAETPSP